MANPSSPDLVFGQIYRTKIYFQNTDTTRNKFLIVVGNDKANSRILFLLTSSRKDKFPVVDIVTKNIIEIKAGEIPSFPADSTIIDCRTVYAESYQWFQDRLKNLKIELHGELLRGHKDKIKQIAFSSALIAQRYAKIIFNA